MKFRFIIISSIVLSSLFVSGIYAQTAPVSVKDCVSIALQNNPLIRVAVEEENKAFSSYRITQSSNSLIANFGLAPNAWDFTKKEVPTIVSASTGYYPSVGLTGTYPLFNPGSGQRETISRKNIDIAKLQGKQSKDDIVLNVKTLYYGYIRTVRITGLREQMKKNYQDRLSMLKIFVKNGDRPVLDQSQAEVSLSQVDLEYRKSLTQQQEIMADLKAQMGLQGDAPDLTTMDFPEIPELKYKLDQVQDFVDIYSSTVLVAKVRTEQARLGISAARALHFPFVTFTSQLGYLNKQVNLADAATFKYLYQKNNAVDSSLNTLTSKTVGSWEPTISFGINAVISVYSGGRINAAVDGAIADYNKSLFNERRQIIEAKKNVKNYVQKLTEFKEQIVIARLNIENSRVNLTLSKKSFESGIVSQLVVQNAEMSFLQAEMNMIDAQFEYMKTMATLSNLIGLEEEFLCGSE